MASIPFEPRIAGWPINVHLILEYLAFFVAYRYYVYLRDTDHSDPISSQNRLSIILGAAIGALLGSRVMAFLENPIIESGISLFYLFNLKTIMGGLFGGLLGVEIAKLIIKEKHSSGDLFTLPIIAGLFIGRIGCFLAGTNEFTYGKTTSFITGMSVGDGLLRHPLPLYELVFLGILFFLLRDIYNRNKLESGFVFKFFMLSYFAFRFFLEFLKPNEFFFLGLSSIQWLCIVCFVYYRKTLINLPRAYKKVYLL